MMKMDFLGANSVEELKKCGKLADLRKEIIDALGDNISVKSKSWADFYSSLAALQKLAVHAAGAAGKKPPKDLYFRGEAEKYIFYLLELDGKERLDKLAVSRLHYAKKDIAEKWKNKIAKAIHPDVCKHPLAEKATAQLNGMYQEMIK